MNKLTTVKPTQQATVNEAVMLETTIAKQKIGVGGVIYIIFIVLWTYVMGSLTIDSGGTIFFGFLTAIGGLFVLGAIETLKQKITAAKNRQKWLEEDSERFYLRPPHSL